MSIHPITGVVLALSALVLSVAAPASAEVYIYSDRSAWEANTKARVNRNFNHLPEGQQTPLQSPYVDQGVSFSATNNYLYSWGPAGCCQGRDSFGTGGSWLIGPWSNGSLEVKLPSGTNAVGFDVGAYNGYPPFFTATVRMASGQRFAAVLTPKASNGHVFLGIADGQGSIVSVTFTSRNADNVVLDNVATGIATTP